jgi:rhodanese-related sulfurtransferase
VNARDAYAKKDAVQFIDVRHAYEFEAGHVEGSRLITLQEIPARFEEIDRDVPVVVTCQIGQRSALAAKFLRDQGYDAHNLEGGVEAWAAEGLPLVSKGSQGTVVDGWAETLGE